MLIVTTSSRQEHRCASPSTYSAEHGNALLQWRIALDRMERGTVHSPPCRNSSDLRYALIAIATLDDLVSYLALTVTERESSKRYRRLSRTLWTSANA